MDLNEKGLKAAIEAYDAAMISVPVKDYRKAVISATVQAYLGVIGDLVKAAAKDRDNALAIARKNHDQWAELDRASRTGTTFAEINAAARAEIDRRGLTPNVRMKVWRALKDARLGLSLAAHYDANSDMPDIRRSVDEALALLTPAPEESEIVE